jgi:hypothetical protein
MESDKENAKKHFESLKKSGLYDKHLKMYKVCDSLLSESNEIGRTRVFLPGWLENESVFMHMEFKYLLGLLKAGLYDEFFNSVKTCFLVSLILKFTAEAYWKIPHLFLQALSLTKETGEEVSLQDSAGLPPNSLICG